MDNYFDNSDWLAARLGRFTASEIHLLFTSGKKKGEMFGQSAMTYIRTKAAEVLTMEAKEDINFKQAEWGKAHEAEAWQAFEKRMGISATYYGAANPTFFPVDDYEGCSPDWEGEGIGADFKCPYNSAEHLKNMLLTGVEAFKAERWEYYCQLQMSMFLRDWKKSYFVSYDPRFAHESMQLVVLEVLPDAEWEAEYQARVGAAVEILKSIILRISNGYIAQYDPALKATIIESITLQKI